MPVSPYDPRVLEHSQEKITLHGKSVARKITSGNNKVTPQEIIDWLANLNTDGWTNLRVRSHTVPGDENNLETELITVTGDRLETDKEFQDRQASIISRWQRDYEEFLLKMHYYQNTDLGKAQIAAVEEKKSRRIRKPPRT